MRHWSTLSLPSLLLFSLNRYLRFISRYLLVSFLFGIVLFFFFFFKRSMLRSKKVRMNTIPSIDFVAISKRLVLFTYEQNKLFNETRVLLTSKLLSLGISFTGFFICFFSFLCNETFINKALKV